LIKLEFVLGAVTQSSQLRKSVAAFSFAKAETQELESVPMRLIFEN